MRAVLSGCKKHWQQTVSLTKSNHSSGLFSLGYNEILFHQETVYIESGLCIIIEDKKLTKIVGYISDNLTNRNFL